MSKPIYKLATINKAIGLALRACKLHKGKGLVHYWSKQALYYLMQARQFLKEGLNNLCAFCVDMALRRVDYAKHELTIRGMR